MDDITTSNCQNTGWLSLSPPFTCAIVRMTFTGIQGRNDREMTGYTTYLSCATCATAMAQPTLCHESLVWI